MNKLILIGNGFDLAHGLKTDYNSFVTWFITKCFSEAINNLKPTCQHILEMTLDNIPTSVNPCSFDGVEDLVEGLLLGKIDLRQEGMAIKLKDDFYTIRGVIKSSLLRDLLINYREYNWVDIENNFYAKLKEVLNQRHAYLTGDRGTLSVKERRKLLQCLNCELDDLKNQLSLYLIEVSRGAKVNLDFAEYIEEDINPNAILEKHHFVYEPLYRITTKAVKILDFNYTGLVRKLKSKINIGFIHIHGSLENEKNPLIFGYGDEIDESYHEMEKTNINDYFKHIKSFGYFRTDNYSKLVNFISSEPFIIYIWGHSCGLSDRTLLNMIFEHDNCAGIKVFYHQQERGRDNFEEITQNIARHFKDKVKMRNRVFNKTYCAALPQS
ncbi:AbiH family protein [Sphingobacterium sp. LRF_L2]|uniref:AbiH family protein n=1 Tax=Sphingobacterium sp. LRF_L2 TaxID=3369421 RepID=UPI003F5DF5AD